MRFTSAVLALIVATSASAELGNGFGSHFPWQSTLEAAWKQAQKEQKPLMVVVSKEWCGSCKALKAVFSKSEEVLEAAQGVVMVALENEPEADDEKYRPSGASYIPRFMFFSPDGRLLPLTSNSEKYAYYYHGP